MEQDMMENGSMDRNMERGYTLIHLEKFIKDYGKRINW
jgi:hypothetical protein